MIGFSGVCWNQSLDKFQSFIKIEGKQNHLGLYPTFEEAAAARYAAEAKHGFRREYSPLSLFRDGFDTAQIGKILGIPEAEAMRRVNRDRSFELGLDYPF